MRPSYDGPSSWLWFVGAARIAVIFIIGVGGNFFGDGAQFRLLLFAIYAGALGSSLWYLVSLRRESFVSARLTWTQVLVDFAVVSATISVTGGDTSFFTPILVIVILEAGVLMGLVQGFMFACLATFFMFFHFFVGMPALRDVVMHWYNFLIQGIAFFFTAFISGYWNQRVSGMKQFQREILDNMNAGFLITDGKGIVIAVNKAACQILNLIEGNVAGRHVDGIMRPDSGAECPVMTALRSKKDFASYELNVVTGPDSAKLIGLTTSRIRDVRGHVTGLITSFTDLTEMARMRKELQQQDRLAAVGELAAGLAHEIRNPVATVRGAMDEVQRGINSPAVVKRLAAIAVRESDHLNEIVSGFLDYARSPARRFDRVDLRGVAEETREQLAHKYQQAKLLHLVVDAPGEACEILADRTQIRQVFTNIAQNAVEAMGGRGALTIALTRGRGFVEARFDDEGPGIDPDKVAKIFEPFYTDRENGVGMGLAICMRIITAHDGTIRVASRPGGGTSMIVRLPAADD